MVRLGGILQRSYFSWGYRRVEKDNENLRLWEIPIRKHPHEFLSDRTDWVASWRKTAIRGLQNDIRVETIQTNGREWRENIVLPSSAPTGLLWGSFVGSQQYLWWGRHIGSVVQNQWRKGDRWFASYRIKWWWLGRIILTIARWAQFCNNIIETVAIRVRKIANSSMMKTATSSKYYKYYKLSYLNFRRRLFFSGMMLTSFIRFGIAQVAINLARKNPCPIPYSSQPLSNYKKWRPESIWLASKTGVIFYP